MRYTLTEGVSKMDTPFSASLLLTRCRESRPRYKSLLFQGGPESGRPFFIPKGFCAGINTKILIVTCYLLPRVSFPDFGLQFLVNIKLRMLTSF